MAVHKAKNKEDKVQQPQLVPQTPEMKLNELTSIQREIDKKEALIVDNEAQAKQIKKDNDALEGEIHGLRQRHKAILLGVEGGQQTFAPQEKKGNKSVMDQSAVTTVEELDRKTKAAGE